MKQCALHVQHKDREVFDRENRVLPLGVVAVSRDTGGVRFGNGVTPWRNLTRYGVETGTPAENPTSGFSGPLHVTVYDDATDGDAEVQASIRERVPGRDEMVFLPTEEGFVFGNGVDALEDLRVIPFITTDPVAENSGGGF